VRFPLPGLANIKDAAAVTAIGQTISRYKVANGRNQGGEKAET
jgi:hypothetical protein